MNDDLRNKYEVIMGLEVHVELNTKTKMFCRCSANYFGAEPNTHTCPVCLGLPGALPFINREAIEDCIKIGLALNCEVPEYPLFERKNYFYPDLAKGFQTSQYRWPQTVNGWIIVENDNGEKSKIRINRAHQEEDTGKLTHSGGESLIDYNRSSVPLTEIVTEADFRDSSQIRDYAKKLQQIFRYLGVSNADMERGDMRLEANVSIRKLDENAGARDENGYLDPKYFPPYRVELKNINSFRFMVAAVEYEIKRQTEMYEEGREDELHQETRGWNEDKRETYVQRSKENANDYRYFPEPDLPMMKIDRELVEKLRKELPELPMQKVERYIKELGISEANAKILSESKDMAVFFEEAVEYGKSKNVSAKDIANAIVNTDPRLRKDDGTSSDPKQVVDDILAKKASVVSDDSVIEKFAQEAIEENPDMVASYKAGKVAVLQALIGQVMRKSQGKADAGKTREILERLLA
jgi:aspartyl-tRNA(Asn)/glutamyl-tRNA(Gln) amidotransferase subunit B